MKKFVYLSLVMFILFSCYEKTEKHNAKPQCENGVGSECGIEVGDVFFKVDFDNPYDSVCDTVFIKDLQRGYALCSLSTWSSKYGVNYYGDISFRQESIGKYYRKISE